ncbi:hypothetical protein EC973_005538 [Apophysomyces ossiformis]|uniref:RING-type domain-containing protein n=1 Tax=Apophysomyces ossiformis TaxID=679940 RepID=A0A8H7EK33_9FUNG|nr:hypothetical protein EC973_005538 [Apophysomyces ossiformis]
MAKAMHTEAFLLLAYVTADKNDQFRNYSSNQEHLIEIHLRHPANPGQKPCLYGDAEFQRLLHGREEWVEQRLSQCDDVEIFLADLKDTLETIPTAKNTISAQRYKRLVAELHTIGFDRIQHMSESLDRVAFDLNVSNRLHAVHAYFPPTYPIVAAQLSIDIPCEVSMEPSTSLEDMLTQCRNLLAQYDTFFTCMEEIDTYTRVLEPEKPTRRDTWRRIALGNHCSVHVEIDPLMPRETPKVRFFGSEKRIAGLLQNWTEYVDHWNINWTPYENLRSALHSTCISQKEVDDSARSDTECGICYSYKLRHQTHGEQTPDVVCTNEQCNRGFHPSCLYEWLRANPKTTRSFNVLFGECPYCNEPTIPLEGNPDLLALLKKLPEFATKMDHILPTALGKLVGILKRQFLWLSTSICWKFHGCASVKSKESSLRFIMFGVIRSLPRGASRAPLTSKKGHNYYKGTGSGAMGRHTKRGGYIIDWNKVRTFVVPDLEGFTLGPYVSRKTNAVAGK